GRPTSLTTSPPRCRPPRLLTFSCRPLGVNAAAAWSGPPRARGGWVHSLRRDAHDNRSRASTAPPAPSRARPARPSLRGVVREATDFAHPAVLRPVSRRLTPTATPAIVSLLPRATTRTYLVGSSGI